MRALSSSELVEVWEWGYGRSPLERGHALLAAACPECSSEQLLRLTVGQRDARLLALRELTFGSRIECQVRCPGCGDRLELAVTTSDLLRLVPPLPDDASAVHEVLGGGWRLEFRLPTCRDLLEATEPSGGTDVRQRLLRGCVLSAKSPGGEPSPAADVTLPPDIEVLLVAEMERRDPASHVEVGLNCPRCGHAWTAPFDILAVFWREIDAWAQRALREVHALAAAYGWTEPDILALSAWRRHIYLQMSGHA